MDQSLLETLRDAISTASGHYYQLVLLVTRAGAGKTAVLQSCAESYGMLPLNVNKELSKGLLELTERQRPLRVPEILGQLVGDGPTPIFLDNIELLFDPVLQQDPLRLLQSLSRNSCMVVSWNGQIQDGKLLYAEMGHPEYRVYDKPEAILITPGESQYQNSISEEVTI